LVLNRIPTAAAVSKKRDAVVVGVGHEPGAVVQYGRDDSGRAVRRGGDDPAARGVLLVDGERVEVHPVHHLQRVLRRRRGQLP
jgi:hypothetical protein